MPSVNLSPETYEKLKALAARKGCTPDETLEVAINKEFAEGPVGAEEWQSRWDAAVSHIREKIPKDVSAAELQKDLDAAVTRARAARRARSR